MLQRLVMALHGHREGGRRGQCAICFRCARELGRRRTSRNWVARKSGRKMQTPKHTRFTQSYQHSKFRAKLSLIQPAFYLCVQTPNAGALTQLRAQELREESGRTSNTTLALLPLTALATARSASTGLKCLSMLATEARALSLSLSLSPSPSRDQASLCMCAIDATLGVCFGWDRAAGTSSTTPCVCD